MMKFTFKDYILIAIALIAFMTLCTLWYIGDMALRHDLKLIAFGVMAGATFIFIALCGKEERRWLKKGLYSPLKLSQ